MNWRFWRKPQPEFDLGQWLDQQSTWMKNVLELLDREFPNEAKDLRVRLELMLMNHNDKTPVRVTEMILAELTEIQGKYHAHTA